MKIEGPAKLLRIYIGESDQWRGGSLAAALVRQAHEQGLAGATVLRGMEGFGANSLVHTTRILRLSEDLPVIVEIVDVEERLNDFLPLLDEMVTEGLVVVQDVQVVKYVASPRGRPGD